MTRKEWLEKFLWMCDRNRPAKEFTQIRVSLPSLKGHLAKITIYRNELKVIYVKEECRKQHEESRRLAALEKAKRYSEDAKIVDTTPDAAPRW